VLGRYNGTIDGEVVVSMEVGSTDGIVEGTTMAGMLVGDSEGREPQTI